MTTAAASARCRRDFTADWRRSRSSERRPVGLAEQNDQDDDEQDDAADSEIHGFAPLIVGRADNVRHVAWLLLKNVGLPTDGRAFKRLPTNQQEACR